MRVKPVGLLIPLLRYLICYSDSGKPKLYAFCGLPTVVTKILVLAEDMRKKEAAIAINYNKDELACVVISLLNNDANSALYKNNAIDFTRMHISKNIFDYAFNVEIQC